MEHEDDFPTKPINRTTAEQVEVLNVTLTRCILSAERLPLGAERQEAYREISKLEEQLAALTDSKSTEGEIARRGAVSAAIEARDYERAWLLGNRYLAEPRTIDMDASLRDLMQSTL
jgi:hypothetical protein